MDITNKIADFADNYTSAFIAATHPEGELIYCNKIATELYGFSNLSRGKNAFSDIFASSNLSIEKMIQNDFYGRRCASYSSVVTTKPNGSVQLANVVIGYFNDASTEIYIEITPLDELHLEIAVDLINYSSRAEAIFERDQSFTAYHCNPAFYQLFQATRESCMVQHGLQFGNTLSADTREQTLLAIHEGITNSGFYHFTGEITTVTGQKRWISADFQARQLDHTSQKIICFAHCIEQEMQQENDLAKASQFLSVMQEFTEDILYHVDLSTMTLHHSYNSDYGVVKNKSIPDYISAFLDNQVVHPEDVNKYLQSIDEFLDGKRETCTVRLALTSPEYVWYKVSAKRIYDDNGKIVEVFGTLVNIDDECTMRDQYSLLNQYFTTIQELSNDILFQIDLKSNTFYHSNRNALQHGLPTEIPDYVNFLIAKQIVPPDDSALLRYSIDRMLSGEEMEFELRAAISDHVYDWFRIKSKFINDIHGNPIEIIGTLENIQKQRDLEAKATHDGLTRVLNIQAFEEAVNRELLHPDIHHALVFIDVDDFKYVNDTFGHQFGDFVLEKFALRISNCIRDTDIIGRLGGDEFVVYLKGVFNSEMALDRANTMLERLKPPFANHEFSHKLGASIGIAMVPAEGTTYKKLYRSADRAVYQSKNLGKNVATLYQSDY